MDENSFVKYLKSEFPFKNGMGIGDDASIIKKENGFMLITKDILLEGVHFDLSYFTLKEIAERAIAVNLSDIAAMGGIPKYLFLGLGIPEYFKEKELKLFFKGIKSGCKKWNVELAGGDLSISPDKLFISITMVGYSSNPIRRDGARVGDFIGVTRGTGGAAVGLELLKTGIDIPEFSQKHKSPQPEVLKGRILASYVHSMIDVSDGLVIDLERLLQSSGIGGEVFYEKIPVEKNLIQICREKKFPELDFVLSGGDDYALLFTIGEENEKKLKSKGVGYHIIGITKSERGLRIVSNGKVLNLKRKGFDHLG